MSLKATIIAFDARLPGDALAKLALLRIADHAPADLIVDIDLDDIAEFTGANGAEAEAAVRRLFEKGFLWPHEPDRPLFTFAHFRDPQAAHGSLMGDLDAPPTIEDIADGD